MHGIVVRSLIKRFGEVLALRDVSFEVGEGELLSLLGPSGCGKTTTLRCIAGLEQGDSGSVTIGDALVSDFSRGFVLPPERRGIGMVFQSYAIWPHMSVARNVGYPLAARRAPKAEIAEAVREALAVVDMAAYADRRATDLSGGQQQRVALARALVGKPKVLLLDEPLSNLDAKLRDQMRIELREIQQRLGVTAVYVTHDQSEAMALSDRIIVMNRGAIEQVGTPEQIYRRPATRFVAEFVGTTNFLNGRVSGTTAGGLTRLTLTTGAEIVVPRQEGREKVLISLRPQFCQVAEADAPVGDGLNAVDGAIDNITYFGERSEARIPLGETTLLAYLPQDAPFRTGDRVRVVFAPDHCVPVAEDDAPA